MYSSYSYGSSNDGALAAAAGIGVIGYLMVLAVAVVTIIAWWKIFTKAGEGGWKILIPFYGSYTQFKVANCIPLFWASIGAGVVLAISGGLLGAGISEQSQGLTIFGGILMAVVFIAVIVMQILFCIGLAKAFGKGGGFAAGLFFLSFIFYCILGFGPAQYVGKGGYSGGYGKSDGYGSSSSEPSL